MKRMIGILTVILTIITVFSIAPIAKATTDKDIIMRAYNVNSSGHAYTTSNTINIEFKAPDSITSDATIYYQTEDYTAISVAGDYTAVKGSVTLSNTHRSETISIDISETPFAVQADGKVNVKYFKFKVTNIDYSEGSIDRTEILCDLRYSHLYLATTENNKTYFDIYKTNRIKDNSTHVSCDFSLTAPGHIFTSSNCYAYSGNKFDSDTTVASWLYDYVQTGLASIYGGMETYNMNDFGYGSADLYINLRRGSTQLQQFHFDYSGFSNDHRYYSEQYYVADKFEIHDRDNTVLEIYDGDTKVYRVLKLTNYLKDETNLSNITLNIEMDNNESTRDRQSSFTLTEILYDDINPFVKNVYGLNNTNIGDDKTRVAVKFNEPVQVKDDKDFYAKVKLGLNTSYNFKYEYGSGTDTLIFVIDNSEIKSTGNFTQVYFDNFVKIDESGTETDFRDIFDFGYDKSGNQNSVIVDGSQKKGAADFNFRTPEIKSATSTNSSTPSKTREVNVEVDDVAKGTLYYCFSKSDTLEITSTDNIQSYLKQYYGAISCDGNQVVKVQAYDEKGNFLDGEYYLHLYLKSSNGKGVYMLTGVRNVSGITPYKFDSKAPDISNIEVSQSVTDKTITATITDPVTSYGLSKAVLEIDKPDGSTFTKTVNITEKLVTETEVSFAFTAEEAGYVGEVYGYSKARIIAYDNCGNYYQKELDELKFDTRQIFEVKESIGNNPRKKYETKYEEKVLKVTPDKFYEIVSYYYDDDEPLINTKFAVYHLEFRGNVIIDKTQIVNRELYDTYIIAQSIDLYKEVSVQVKGEGLLKIILSLNFNPEIDTTATVTKEFCYYLSENFDNELTNTTNILDSHYVKNKVYVLKDKNYYYMDETNAVTKKSYTSTTKNMVFSSKSKAQEYVYYNELQDMKVLYLDDSSDLIVNWLNTGSSTAGYYKSNIEKKIAQKGQYWVRYKESTWDYSTQASSWVYYYLCNDTDVDAGLIDSANLPTALKTAINSVTDRIVEKGDYVYYAGSEYTKANGYPDITDDQIIITDLTATKTICNSSFKSEITVEADYNIYADYKQSYTYVNKQIVYSLTDDVHYLMHYIADFTDKDTRLYYVAYDETLKDDYFSYDYQKNYKEIPTNTKVEIDSLFPDNVSSTYLIIELGKNGVNVIKVFVDKEAPIIELAINGQTKYDNYNYKTNGISISSSSIKIGNILSKEADIYSYVHIYKESNADYKLTYSLEDLLKNELVLEDGNYTLLVSDRYGNSYKLDVNVKSNTLDVVAQAKGNSYFYVSVNNRSEKEIQSYEIRKDGVLVRSNYTDLFKMNESGIYQVLIVDIYGNKYENTIKFERALPEISYRYEVNGAYYKYDEENPDQPMTLSKTSNGQVHYVKASGYMQVLFSDDYTYEFVGEKPLFAETLDNLTTIRISIKEQKGFTLKVYYPGDTSTSVTIICMLDVTAPNIYASFESYSYLPKDISYFDTEAAKIKEEGVVINPTSHEFECVSKRTAFISNGQLINTNSIKLNISDDNLIKQIIVYLNDDEEYIVRNSFEEEIGTKFEFTLPEIGKYKIVATDIYGNVSTLEFNNSTDSYVKRLIDGKVNGSLDCSYGSISDSIVIKQNGLIVYKIQDNDNTYVYTFMINNEGIEKVAYVTKLDKDVMKWAQIIDEAVYLFNSSKYNYNKWYSANDFISVKVNEDGSIEFKASPTEGKITIDYTFCPETSDLIFTYKSVISNEFTNIPLVNKNDDQVIETNNNNDVILVHDEFIIDYDKLEASEITEIKYGYLLTYNKISDFKELNILDFANKEELNTTEDGFYYFVITNIYGNVTTYILNKFVKINIKYTVTYANDSVNTYSTNYSDYIYSNYSVGVMLYDNHEYQAITVKKYFKGYFVDYSVLVTEGKNYYSFEIKEEGLYTVTVVDYYGNIKTKTVEIKKADISYDNSMITGWNKNALVDNYTSNVLSFNKAKLEELDIKVVKVNNTVIYNTLQEGYENDFDLLTNAIGKENERLAYKITLIDKYGNEFIETIYYSSYSTLSVFKNSKTDLTYKLVDENTNVYTNNGVKLTTTSIKYKFYVEGVEDTLSKEFSYQKDGNYLVKKLKYIDEYGFVLEFSINILRQDIEIAVDANNDEKLIDDILTVNHDFMITHTSGTVCTYSIDGAGEYTYDDSYIKNDGVYYFTAKDIFGNEASLRVKRDTTVEFKLVDYYKDKALFNNGVANNDKVVFKALNKDILTVLSITKDGKEYDKETTTFTEHGYYTMVIKDAIGNEVTFNFYIITHAMCEFNYQIPEGYSIKEMYLEAIKGYKDFYTEYDQEGFSANKDGNYTVVLKNNATDIVDSFTFTIDNTKPEVYFENLTDGSTTSNNIKLLGVKEGDTVYVYRNGKLEQKITIDNEDSVELDKAGNYKIIVRNQAGLETTLTVNKKFIMNTAGSVLIIGSIITISTILFVGLMLRKRSKVDR